MTKQEHKSARIKALRLSTAKLYQLGFVEANGEPVNSYIHAQARAMYGKAYKLGGEFNRFTGGEMPF